MEQHASLLAKLFEKFPGIGTRQAKRFAYFILTQPKEYVSTLAQSLENARAQARTCSSCLRIFDLPALPNSREQTGGNNSLCGICANETRDHGSIIIVEKSQDIDAFARTEYNGIFFVLGGLIPIVQKNVLAGTNIAELVDRVKSTKGISEIILAFPVTPNGEHTDQVIREMLAPYASGISISSLGRGLSTGTELEYADPASLSASLKKRE